MTPDRQRIGDGRAPSAGPPLDSFNNKITERGCPGKSRTNDSVARAAARCQGEVQTGAFDSGVRFIDRPGEVAEHARGLFAPGMHGISGAAPVVVLRRPFSLCHARLLQLRRDFVAGD